MRNILKFLFYVGILTSVQAQTTVKDLKQKIAQVKKEIAEQENKSQQEAQRDLDYRKLANSRSVRLNQQIALVKSQKDSLSKELSQLKSTAKKTKGASYWYDKKRSRFSGFLAVQIDSLVTHFKHQFPYEVESRLESLSSLSARLKAQNIQPEEALDRVWTILAESMKSGYEVESWKGSLEQPSGQLQGQYLRVGHVFEYFLVDKSDAVFVLSLQDTQWLWRPLELSLEERNYLRHAMKVKAGQASPELVRLPVPLPFLLRSVSPKDPKQLIVKDSAPPESEPSSHQKKTGTTEFKVAP